MANVKVEETYLQDTADAIRAKSGSESKFTPAQFASAVESIEIGVFPEGDLPITSNGNYNVRRYERAVVDVPVGIFPEGDLSISANGTYPVREYKRAVVDVPTGVFPSGELTVSANGTYACDVFANVVVNVPAGSGNGNFLVSFLENTFSEINDSTVTVINRPDAFNNDTSIKLINLPNVSSVCQSGLRNVRYMETLSLPACTWLGASAIAGCSSLYNVYIPNVEYAGPYAMTDWDITSITLPKLSDTTKGLFIGCRNLTYVDLPLVSGISFQTFSACSKLVDCSFPNVTHVNKSAFHGCSNLSTLVLPKVVFMSSYAFYLAYSFKRLVLPSSSVCRIDTSITFIQCGITSPVNGIYDGHVYVPESLVDTYKAADYWSTLHSSCISAITPELKEELGLE